MIYAVDIADVAYTTNGHNKRMPNIWKRIAAIAKIVSFTPNCIEIDF